MNRAPCKYIASNFRVLLKITLFSLLYFNFSWSNVFDQMSGLLDQWASIQTKCTQATNVRQHLEKQTETFGRNVWKAAVQRTSNNLRRMLDDISKTQEDSIYIEILYHTRELLVKCILQNPLNTNFNYLRWFHKTYILNLFSNNIICCQIRLLLKPKQQNLHYVYDSDKLRILIVVF